jgi:SAM-dependent methyltransferase
MNAIHSQIVLACNQINGLEVGGVGFGSRFAGSRAYPTRFTTGYLTLRNLSRLIREHVAASNLTKGAVVIDVGCGDMPYREFIRADVTYLGLDYPIRDFSGKTPPPCERSRWNEFAFGSAEKIPIRSECVDLVICTQVLEHVEYPSEVVREILRLLKPGGTVLLSTHGVFPVHPCPKDYWRWTAGGLEKLFESFWSVRVFDVCSTLGTFAFLVEDQVSFSLSGARSHFKRLVGHAIRWALNLLGEALEKAFPNSMRDRPLVGVYLVVATKGEQTAIRPSLQPASHEAACDGCSVGHRESGKDISRPETRK